MNISGPLQRFADRALTPLRCAFCGRATAKGHICAQCATLLPWNSPCCERCGQGLPAAQPSGIPCAACQANPPPFAAAHAPLHYAFPVDAALKAIKFRRQLWYVPAFAEVLENTLAAHCQDADALVPVPLHRWRQFRRGFNQALELSAPLAQASGLPLIGNVHRQRATRPQSGLPAAARRKNLAGAFAVSGPLRCRQPVIVDDVITTGETCAQLARLLLDSGAERVTVLAVARATVRGIRG